jgi:hypothetical protein
MKLRGIKERVDGNSAVKKLNVAIKRLNVPPKIPKITMKEIKSDNAIVHPSLIVTFVFIFSSLFLRLV